MRKIALAGILAVTVALAGATTLAGCSTSGSGSSSGVSGVSSTSNVSSSAAASGGVVTIPLDNAAGTGFEWTCSAAPEGVVEQVGRVTENRAAPGVTGGPLQERFTFRAVAPGEVVLTFALARSWEDGGPAETQVYAFKVDDDLKMVLNPYKSDFVNEPEQGE